jgi:hypothetical protein
MTAPPLVPKTSADEAPTARSTATASSASCATLICPPRVLLRELPRRS